MNALNRLFAHPHLPPFPDICAHPSLPDWITDLLGDDPGPVDTGPDPLPHIPAHWVLVLHPSNLHGGWLDDPVIDSLPSPTACAPFFTFVSPEGVRRSGSLLVFENGDLELDVAPASSGRLRAWLLLEAALREECQGALSSDLLALFLSFPTVRMEAIYLRGPADRVRIFPFRNATPETAGRLFMAPEPFADAVRSEARRRKLPGF